MHLFSFPILLSWCKVERINCLFQSITLEDGSKVMKCELKHNSVLNIISSLLWNLFPAFSD